MNIQIYEEATNWLIKHRETDLNPREKTEFDNWLRASPQHAQAYLEISAVWECVPALDPSWNATPDQLIARAISSEGNIYPLADAARMPSREPDPQSSSHQPGKGPLRRFASLQRPRSWKMRPVAIAATFLAAIVGAAVWYGLTSNTYATDIGEQRSIVLADGSTIELNSRSRVRIRYTDTQRNVDLLEGQALFGVAHNTARPFIVHSGPANVRAVGTRFDVYKKRAGTVVTVVEGKVAILVRTLSASGEEQEPEQREGGAGPGSASGTAISDPSFPSAPALTPHAASKRGGSSAIFLAAGDQLTIPALKPSRVENSSSADTPQRVNVSAATAWTHRSLVLESTPLAEVAEEFNRYNTRQLVINDPEVANIHISGIFSSVDPALLLKFLRTQPEVDVKETETEIRVGKR